MLAWHNTPLESTDSDQEYAREILRSMRGENERRNNATDPMAYIAPLFMLAAFVWAIARFAHAFGF